MTMTAYEWQAWQLDAEINRRGLPIDLDLVRAAIAIDTEHREQLTGRAMELMGIANPNSRDQFLDWLRGEEVGGRIEGEGLTLEAHGNVAATTVRAWLRSPAGQPRTEGVLLGDVRGDRLTGTWRTSGPGGVEVRAGTFEAHR